MKYLLIITTILLSKFCYSQQFYNRTLGTTTPNDPFLSSSRAFYMPRSLDTTLNGGLDSIGALMYDRIRAKLAVRDTVLSGGHKFTFLFKQDDTATTLATQYDLTQLPQTTLSNIGTAYRWVATSDGQIKTVSSSNTILWDSTSTANSLTGKVDTSVIATQFDLGSAQTIQQVLTTGDTTLRQMIWKDTASATGTNSLLLTTVVPSDYGTIYTNGVGGLFQSSIAKFISVNPDGRPNVVGNFWGYNVNPAGGRINTNEAAFRFGTETHYQLDVSQNPAFEFHLPEITTQSGSIYRPLSLYIRKNSGYTNVNMQAHSINYATQESGSNWGSYSYDSNVTINYTAGANSKRVSINAQLPNFIGTMVYDSTGWSISSSVTNSTKQFGTNLPIRYGASSNRSGMDGYGDVTFREGKNTIFNTGTNTVFADWQFNSSQKFNFTKDNAVFSVSLLTVGSANIVPVGGSKIISANGEALLISSSAGAGSDIRLLNGVDNARSVTIFQAASGAGNVNIGTSTTNPAHKLRVQGSVVVDSNLYVGMHDIASNSDTALVWDRATQVYKIARITGIPVTTLYTGDGTLPGDRTISTGGFTTTWTGSNDGETSFSVVNTGTTNASAILGSATGTTSIGVRGTSTSYLGVYGSSTSNNGVQGESSSGTGVVGVSTTGAAFRGQINPSSTNAVENIVTLLRTTSAGAGSNGIGSAIQYELETATNGTVQTAGSLSFEWIDATNTTRTSRFSIKGVNSAANNTLATFDGNGNVTFGAANNIVGTATNNDAVAGNIGEEVNSTVSTYTNYTTTATYQNITSITLTAGDWDLSAFFTYSSNSATITGAANAIFVISTTTASAAGATEGKNIAYLPQAALLGTSLFSDAISPYRVSLSGTTTYYLNTQATFTVGNPQYVGGIRARRVR